MLGNNTRHSRSYVRALEVAGQYGVFHLGQRHWNHRGRWLDWKVGVVADEQDDRVRGGQVLYSVNKTRVSGSYYFMENCKEK